MIRKVVTLRSRSWELLTPGPVAASELPGHAGPAVIVAPGLALNVTEHRIEGAEL